MEADVPAAAVPVTQGLGINLQLSQWDSLEIVPPWITFNWFLGPPGDYVY